MAQREEVSFHLNKKETFSFANETQIRIEIVLAALKGMHLFDLRCFPNYAEFSAGFFDRRAER